MAWETEEVPQNYGQRRGGQIQQTFFKEVFEINAFRGGDSPFNVDQPSIFPPPPPYYLVGALARLETPSFPELHLTSQQFRRREKQQPLYEKQMGPGGIFARVAHWLANEVIVKGLANNPAFQRFAVRSAQQAQELSKTAAQAAKNIAESENVSQLRKESKAIREQASDFASALREEIQEAMRNSGQGKQPPSVSRKN